MRPRLAAKKNGGFDPNTFLATVGEGRKILSVPKKQTIFAQGDGADAVFYLQKGKVRLTVVSKIGKEATIAIVSEGQFFGEGSLAGQLLRMGSAVAMTDCEILRVEKKAMIDVLHREAAVSQRRDAPSRSARFSASTKAVDRFRRSIASAGSHSAREKSRTPAVPAAFGCRCPHERQSAPTCLISVSFEIAFSRTASETKPSTVLIHCSHSPWSPEALRATHCFAFRRLLNADPDVVLCGADRC